MNVFFFSLSFSFSYFLTKNNKNRFYFFYFNHSFSKKNSFLICPHKYSKKKCFFQNRIFEKIMLRLFPFTFLRKYAGESLEIHGPPGCVDSHQFTGSEHQFDQQFQKFISSTCNTVKYFFTVLVVVIL